MNAEIEKLKQRLVNDLRDNPYSLSDPVGTNLTYQKIQDYLFACVKENMGKAEIADWLYNLYSNQTDEEKQKFSSHIDLLIGALQNFYSWLNKRSFNVS